MPKIDEGDFMPYPFRPARPGGSGGGAEESPIAPPEAAPPNGTSTGGGGSSRDVGEAIRIATTSSPEGFAYHGVRTDLPGGRGIRTRIGRLSDGSYGIERYTSTGVRQVVTWS